MPEMFRIHFDRPHAAYFAGEMVVGRVIMNVAKPKKVRAVTVQFKGEANVRWSETSTLHKRKGVASSQTVTFSAHETYFENTLYFLGGEHGEVNVVPGEYAYDFQWLLPQTLPSSFEGACGHIRYTAKVVMHRPWKFDHGAKAAFTVVAPLDLNALPQATGPVELQVSKHFCWLWCRSGPLVVHVRLPAGGYVPGQIILLQVQVDNASTTRVEGISCALSNEVKWHANRTVGSMSTRAASQHTRVTTNNVAQVEFDGNVEAHGSKVFSQMITVPALPPSNLAHCSIIDLQYVLKVRARVGGLHLDPHLRAPILIGTFPVRYAPAPQPPTFDAALEAAEFAASSASAPPFNMDLPPPSYEECLFKGNNIMDAADNEYTMGIGDFTPRYPVWDFNSPDPQEKSSS